MFVIPLVAVLLPVMIGQRYGLYVRRKSADVQDAPIGSVVGAALGLLAFMLAFTFDIVSNRYSDRKELLLQEVTDIRTTYLRAGLIPEPLRSESRKVLVEYVDLRVSLAKDFSNRDYGINRSQQILDSLWKGAETLAAQDKSSEAYSLYTGSVNDLVNLFNQRITLTFQYRIPETILYVLCIIAFFSMLTLGYQFGISGKENFTINLFLAIVFGAVMWLILALDHPETGLIQLNQQPVFVLQQQLHQSQNLK
jgi:hypothetical protein